MEGGQREGWRDAGREGGMEGRKEGGTGANSQVHTSSIIVNVLLSHNPPGDMSITIPLIIFSTHKHSITSLTN